ncbi:hypothetical protein SVAN01_04437 [Stagonosporopsis vannaccii]|nr:hypothetical protein SVAN01_04437 [Stagonosporopsis vannaccii]
MGVERRAEAGAAVGRGGSTYGALDAPTHPCCTGALMPRTSEPMAEDSDAKLRKSTYVIDPGRAMGRCRRRAASRGSRGRPLPQVLSAVLRVIVVAARSNGPSPNHDPVVALTSALDAGAAVAARAGIREYGEAEAGGRSSERECVQEAQQQQRWRKGASRVFQEQNCRGCHREMSSPITFPPVATSKAPLTWAQSDEASLIAPTAQNLDAAPASSMLQGGIHVMTTRLLLQLSLAARNSCQAPIYIVPCNLPRMHQWPALPPTITKR